MWHGMFVSMNGVVFRRFALPSLFQRTTLITLTHRRAASLRLSANEADEHPPASLKTVNVNGDSDVYDSFGSVAVDAELMSMSSTDLPISIAIDGLGGITAHGLTGEVGLFLRQLSIC